jgi:hypothetical protein
MMSGDRVVPTFQETGEQIANQHERIWTKETFDRLYKMIDYGVKRQDWYEDQRNKILSLAVALLGLSSFLVSGLLSPAVETMYLFRIFGFFTLLSIVTTALLIIHKYAQAAGEQYTHRSLADVRSWFFAYVVRDPEVLAASFVPARHQENSAALMRAWERFVRGWLEFQETNVRRGVEDLQQVFILYLFQAMRRRSLRAMLECASRGGQVIGVFLILTIIFAGLRI